MSGYLLDVSVLVALTVSSNPEAVAVLKRLTDLPGHHFWPDEIAVVATGHSNP